MKNTLALLLLSIVVYTVDAQSPNSDPYKQLVRKADSLYHAKDYFHSGLTYSQAFKSNSWKGLVNDRYNAACSWSLANVPDSAFANLLRIANNGNYSNYDHMISDTDLNALHTDARWTQVMQLVRKNKDEKEKNLNKELVNTLKEMVKEDQKWRLSLRNFNNGELASDTISREYIHRQIQVTDSLHYIKLWDIFIMHGFPNYDLVGEGGSGNFWLLIQHQDLQPKFQKAVLEKMKIEVDRAKANPINYAYLIDRVNLNTGQMQVYGTQMILNAEGTSYVPQPVIESEKLNERRASVGLEPIEDYIKVMNDLNHGTLKK